MGTVGVLGRAGSMAAPSEIRKSLEVWKDVTFNYESTDTADFVPTATAA